MKYQLPSKVSLLTLALLSNSILTLNSGYTNEDKSITPDFNQELSRIPSSDNSRPFGQIVDDPKFGGSSRSTIRLGGEYRRLPYSNAPAFGSEEGRRYIDDVFAKHHREGKVIRVPINALNNTNYVSVNHVAIKKLTSSGYVLVGVGLAGAALYFADKYMIDSDVNNPDAKDSDVDDLVSKGMVVDLEDVIDE